MKEHLPLFLSILAGWLILLIGAVVTKLRGKDKVSNVWRLFATAFLSGVLTVVTIEVNWFFGDTLTRAIACCLAAIVFNHTVIYLADQLRFRCPSCGSRELLRTADNLDLRIKQCAKCLRIK